MDTKFKEHSQWKEETEEERHGYLSEWLELLGANSEIISERLPLMVRRNKKKAEGRESTKINSRVDNKDLAMMDKICMEFRHRKNRIYETHSDYIRQAIRLSNGLHFHVMKNMNYLSANEDLKFLDYIDYLTRAKNKIDDAIMVLEGYVKMLDSESVSEDEFLNVVETIKKKIPAFCRDQFMEKLKSTLTSSLNTYGKRLVLKIKQ